MSRKKFVFWKYRKMGKVARYGLISSGDRTIISEKDAKVKRKRRKKDLEESHSKAIKMNGRTLRTRTALTKTLQDVVEQREKNVQCATQAVVKGKRINRKKICSRILPEPIVGIYKNGAKGKEVRKSQYITNPADQARLDGDVFKLLQGDTNENITEPNHKNASIEGPSKVVPVEQNSSNKKPLSLDGMGGNVSPISEYRDVWSLICSENFDYNRFLNDKMPDPLIEVKATLRTIYADSSRRKFEQIQDLRSKLNFSNLIETAYSESTKTDVPTYCSFSNDSVDFSVEQSKMFDSLDNKIKTRLDEFYKKTSRKSTINKLHFSTGNSEGNGESSNANQSRDKSDSSNQFLFKIDSKGYRKPSTNDLEGSEFSLDLRKRLFNGIRDLSDRSSEIDLDDLETTNLSWQENSVDTEQQGLTHFSNEHRISSKMNSRNEKGSRTSDNSLQSTQDDLLSLKVNDTTSCRAEDFEINNREDLLARYLRDVAMNKSNEMRDDGYLTNSNNNVPREKLETMREIQELEELLAPREVQQLSKPTGKISRHVPAILRRGNYHARDSQQQALAQNFCFPNGIMCPIAHNLRLPYHQQSHNIQPISPRISDIDTRQLPSRSLKVRHGESRSFNVDLKFLREQRPAKLSQESQVVHGTNQTCIGRARKIVTYTKRKSSVQSPQHEGSSDYHQVFQIEKTRTETQGGTQDPLHLPKDAFYQHSMAVSPKINRQRKIKHSGTHFITLKTLEKHEKPPRVEKDVQREHIGEKRQHQTFCYPENGEARFETMGNNNGRFYVVALNEPPESREMQSTQNFQRPSQEFLPVLNQNTAQSQFLFQRQSSDLTIRNGVNNLQLMTLSGQENLINVQQNRGMIFQDSVQPLKYLAIADNHGIQRIPVYIQPNGQAVVASNFNQMPNPVFVPKGPIVVNPSFPQPEYSMAKHYEHLSVVPAVPQLREPVQIPQTSRNPVFVSDAKDIKFAYNMSGVQPCQFKQVYTLNGLYPVETNQNF
ncbi:uncharacterized protein [Prorops nasuta]|uniref:uncharacterized protein isoform X2 n=1 Tax=Prorops nasuta TaxID=863751 RepID=UPI0034CFD6FE